jgi:hypothetical protein
MTKIGKVGRRGRTEEELLPNWSLRLMSCFEGKNNKPTLHLVLSSLHFCCIITLHAKEDVARSGEVLT